MKRQAHPEIGLLFIDVRMPGMSGPELAKVVRPRRFSGAGVLSFLVAPQGESFTTPELMISGTVSSANGHWRSSVFR